MKKIVGLAIVLASVLSGCIQTPEPDVPKRISILYNIENTGNTLSIGQDTLIVDEIKLLAEKINLTLVDETILQTDLQALVMTYRSQFNGEDETILSSNIGFEDLNRFKGIKLFISPPSDGTNIQDKDFFGQEENFSFIFRGIYKGNDFTYKSSPQFEKDFPFDQNIELTNEKETLLLRIKYDIRDVLIDQSENRILNPQDPEDKSTIDSLLQESINIEAFSADVL